MASQIARRYAQALYRVAAKSNMIAAVEKDLDGVRDVYEQDERFRSLVASPALARDTKARIIEKIFGDRMTSVTMQTIRLLLNKRRESMLLDVREAFSQIRREAGNVLYVTVTSAEPLSDDQRSRLVQRLESQSGKRVEAEYDVVPSLIGGVRVSYDNYVLDGSIRGGLGRLRDALRRDLLKQA